ncbi:hypothetical protein SAY87_007421 [Trapa incisa]|uniref:Uncharacterized protein n=1 Tax=Trapa incisa TaxID=236973 RepID=A0AAN7Q193_9MYRT|nr:hypothetical protein SAY87_007421 [Trapa incisa]
MASFVQSSKSTGFRPLNPSVPLFSPAKPIILFQYSPNSFKTLSSPNPLESSDPDPHPASVDPVKLAFEKAKAYRKSLQTKPSVESVQKFVGVAGTDSGTSGATVPYPSQGDSRDGAEKEPDAVKISMEKAAEYNINKGTLRGISFRLALARIRLFLTNRRFDVDKGTDFSTAVKVEKAKKEDQLVVSSMDFVGLDFGDKKRTRGLPPGLLPVADTFSEHGIKEVEIIVGDTSKFENSTSTKPEPVKENNSETYKPKVSTWGVFPRPSNISKTYGGGRNIRPGEELETAEDRAAKDARTRELLAAYKKKIGLNIDPKLKIECEKALKDGDCLMDSGNLKEALLYYEKIMDKLPFQSEIHGRAALQWSICQDSLTRRTQARSMYEKLQNHPNPKVRKRAKQFMFSFQAMEMMKVGSSRFSSSNTGYQNYFEAFVEDKVDYTSPNGDEAGQGPLISNAFPYLIFLFSPVFVVIFIAMQKGR